MPSVAAARRAPDPAVNTGKDGFVAAEELAASHQQVAMPAAEPAFIVANAEIFGASVTGWGMPGGADADHASALDVPLVRDLTPSGK